MIYTMYKLIIYLSAPLGMLGDFLNQPQISRYTHSLSNVTCMQFLEKFLLMEFYSIGFNKERFTYLRVRKPLYRELENLFLAVGKNQFGLFFPASSLERIKIPVGTGRIRNNHLAD